MTTISNSVQSTYLSSDNMKHPQIVTEFVNPPIPIRDYDWRAALGDIREDVQCGWGPTRSAAIKDLAEKSEDVIFADTGCSQCGCSFGPGTHGYSHCSDHRKS